MQWIGGDYQCLNDFCGNEWTRADAIEPYCVSMYPDVEQVVVWNKMERFWVPVPVGHYIVRGLEGELYSCDPALFRKLYEPIETMDMVG